tara:strand:- start:29255 stop:29488 length:234 start_codon:yes stop_codon:yes gene_type:complete
MEPALPNPLFAALYHARAAVLRSRHMTRKRRFDVPPPCRKIGVSVWKRPDHMEMGGQNYSRANIKGHLLLAQAHRDP